MTGRTAVIVGAGRGARARARALEAAGARVVAVPPAEYRPEVCRGAFLVMAHSDDPALDRRVAADARARGCLCYAHDQPAISDFAMPAVARRGPVTLAVSTDALAPALARRLRGELQAALDHAGEALDRLVAELTATRAALPAATRRARLLALARRLRLTGRFEVEPPRPGQPDADPP